MAGPASAAPVLLGLGAAATWGGSDFAGGLGTRRSPALLIVASGHLVTLLALAAICTASRLPLPHLSQLAYGLAGGLEGAFALALFYRALAMGAMGLTAARTGLLTALVPVIFALCTLGLPRPVALAGLVLGALAIWLIAYAPGHDTPPLALLFGAIAGLGFGLQLILLHLASGESVMWGMTFARLGGVLGVGLVLTWIIVAGSAQSLPRTGFWRMGILAGSLDALGNLAYAWGSHAGRLDIAATVASLYPGFTILLAALILHERPSSRQRLGMVVALASVVLLSL